jgi:hypothetical protein
MKEGKSKIQRGKGIEICTDFLFIGQGRKEIVQHLTENYIVCVSSVDKWIKIARPLVKLRQDRANAIKQAEEDQATRDVAKRLNISREWVLEQYYKLASFDPRKAFTVDGGYKGIHELPDDVVAAIGGIEAISDPEGEGGEKGGNVLKLKFLNRKDALDSISKIMGYSIPAKIDLPTEDLSSITLTFK